MDSLDENDTGSDSYIVLSSGMEYPSVFMVKAFLTLILSFMLYGIIGNQKQKNKNFLRRKL